MNGELPAGEIKPVDVPAYRPDYRVSYQLVDNSENREGAVVTYFLEEVDVDVDKATNAVIAVHPRDENTIRPVGDDPENDNIEIVQDEPGQGSFIITNDAGYYRIRIENRYKGTLRTHYTNLFHVVIGN